ncbi:MAG: serine acetyltransferase [Deltaproteobacteria bacterium]|nr:serine acetyltransferase [Deltaproteobacteria bacterium]
MSELERVLDELVAARIGVRRHARQCACSLALPSKQAIEALVEDLRAVLFPGYHGRSELNDDSLRFHIGAALDLLARAVQEQVKRGLCFACDREPDSCAQCDRDAEEIALRFLARLPEIQQALALDVQAAYEGDPAARSPDEAIFAYPGIRAVTNYRLAHALYALDVPLVPRIITEHAHASTGIDIHPGARIGKSFFIDHGTGVVIGETAEIGDRVRIYQGVTLGAKSFPLDGHGRPIKGIARHPIVEDDVIIYSGATILGRVRIGAGSIIGGNVWITRDVPPRSRISQPCSQRERFTDGGGI